jgi:hypothetical protein
MFVNIMLFGQRNYQIHSIVGIARIDYFFNQNNPSN